MQANVYDEPKQNTVPTHTDKEAWKYCRNEDLRVHAPSLIYDKGKALQM
jgi:hypothetical protein